MRLSDRGGGPGGGGGIAPRVRLSLLFDEGGKGALTEALLLAAGGGPGGGGGTPGPAAESRACGGGAEGLRLALGGDPPSRYADPFGAYDADGGEYSRLWAEADQLELLFGDKGVVEADVVGYGEKLC